MVSVSPDVDREGATSTTSQCPSSVIRWLGTRSLNQVAHLAVSGAGCKISSAVDLLHARAFVTAITRADQGEASNTFLAKTDQAKPHEKALRG